MTAIAHDANINFRLVNPGSSEASTKLEHQLEIAFDQLRQSTTWNRLSVLSSELHSILSECCSDDWNGDGACRVTSDVYSNTIDFINDLPIGIEIPELVPEPDGSIGFEWSNCKNKVFIVSVSEKNLISYAGVFGKHRKTHGEERFEGNIPHNIIENIRRVYR